MKKGKRFTLVLTVIALFTVCLAFGATAEETFTEDYYIYTVTDGEATLTGVTPDLNGDVVIPSTLGSYPVVSIGDGAFYENENVTSVVIPDGVRSLGNGVFEDSHCTLKCVIIPDSVTEIGWGVFQECYSLEQVILSENIKIIPPYTFEGCLSLESIELPENLEEVYGISFTGCAKLKELVFPDNVKKIEGYTLMGASVSVEKIVIGANAEFYGPNNSSTFGDLVSLKDFYAYSPNIDFTDSALGYISFEPKGISLEEWRAIYNEYIKAAAIGRNEEAAQLFKKLESVTTFCNEPVVSDILTIHCHTGSTAETYAKENGITYELIHFFEDSEWSYDYDNMVRTRKCTFEGCEATESEPLNEDDRPQPDPEPIPDPTPDTDCDTSDCFCICHKTGIFWNFINALFRMLCKILRVFPVCECGAAHY